MKQKLHYTFDYKIEGAIIEKVIVINVNFNSALTGIDYFAERYKLLLIN